MIQPIKAPHKFEELSETLRNKITTLSSGSRLPSVRSLMKRYRVSLHTVNAALDVLERENLIVTRHGSGSYVSDHREVKLIALHRSRHSSAYEDDKEASMRNAVQARGWFLETRRHEALRSDYALNLIPESKACAHVVMQDLAHLKEHLIEQLIHQKVPVLIFGRENDEFPSDFITTSDASIFGQLLKHLTSFGHKNIAMLVNEPSIYPEMVQRIALFKESLCTFGLGPGTIIDCETPPGSCSAHAAHAGLARYLEKHRGKQLPFTGMIVTSSTGGFGALRAFHEFGIQIPQQCSVVNFGAESQNQLSIPSLTDSGTPIELFGTHVVQMLEVRFDGDAAPFLGRKLPVVITVRESSAPAPPAPAVA